MAVAAAEQGRPTMMFLSKGAVRLAQLGVAVGSFCDGCTPLTPLLERYQRAGGRYLVCPICVHSKNLDGSDLIGGAELGGTVPLWEWVGPASATTFSF
jgi:predicted peroxiredoxin